MIHAIFFLSGVSALVFQHIWFREAGLVFGNSVWAASLVLSSFMAGLAIGNGLAAVTPNRRHPLRWYAFLETLVAFTGVALVFVLPVLGGSVLPRLAAGQDAGLALNAARFLLAFALLVIPTAAMGMTLPLLVGRTATPDLFGVALGRLYGWNTLGAVFGALAGEAFLYGHIGVRNSAFVAGALNLLAALLSLRLARTGGDETPVAAPGPSVAWTLVEARLLLVAALAGGSLLALEVVWTRFLQLFVFGTALAFAILLASVLAGISIGSLLASRSAKWCASPPAIPLLALLSALAVTGSYASFTNAVTLPLGGLPGNPWTRVAILCAALILPSAFLSGALFTAVGAALARSREASRATGLLTLANTLGAMCGALIAGFVLLPVLGMERSFLGLSLTYTLAALISPGFAKQLGASRALLVTAVVSVLFTALFPVGLMERFYLRGALGSFSEGSRISGLREGLTETVAYVDTLYQGEPLYTRLVTNAFSMSGTLFTGRRYMEAFVYLPVAIHPHVKRALLISYGVGATARALIETREIERIDVVDISRDILDMAHYAVPKGEPEPLKDPRVITHVEDGRFFLQAATEGYDLITSEPPPPHLGGVVNLYTLEYFELLRRRLNPGGIVSYWLPVHSLTDDDARAISSAFCSAFTDCTLWKGMNLDWILLGTNNLKGPADAERFKRQWGASGPRDLRDIGLEVPEQLGALFMAEGGAFKDLTRSAPLSDNFPGRLTRSPPPLFVGPWRSALMDSRAGRERFLSSDFIRRMWPAEMRSATLPYFDIQRYYDDGLRDLFGRGRPLSFPMEAIAIMRDTPLEVLPAILLGSSGDMRMLANRMEGRGAPESEWLHAQLGVRELTRRRYDEAARHLRRALELTPSASGVRERLVLALCLGGHGGEAAPERLRLPADLEKAWADTLEQACAAGASGGS